MTPGDGRHRVVVVGADGYLGRALVALAPAGVEVVGTTRSGAGGTEVLDPADARAVRALLGRLAPAAVVNAAGRSSGDDDALHAANVEVVRGLLAGAGEVPLVLVGSAAEYGAPPGADPVPETAPLRPLTAYGRTKAAASDLAAAAHASGRPVVVARLFNLAGPRLPPTTPLGAFTADVLGARDGDTVEVRNGATVRDVVTVGFAVRALVALTARRRWPEPAVNLASGVGLRFDDLVAALARAAGRRVTVRDLGETVPIPAVVGDPARLAAWCGLTEAIDADVAAAACLGDPPAPQMA